MTIITSHPGLEASVHVSLHVMGFQVYFFSTSSALSVFLSEVMWSLIVINILAFLFLSLHSAAC